MAFGALKTDGDKKALNNHLSSRSYIEGYQPTQADTEVFETLKTAPAATFVHILRWYNHIKSYADAKKEFPKSKDSHKSNSKPADDDDEDDDEDVDLFGSDEDEESKAAADKIREERVKAYADKKAKKPTLIAKSSILLDVKPWSDETDMKALEKCVRSIVKDGLLWGASKLVPVGYGINKLQILTIIVDDKISVDALTEEIEDFSDYVQSVDIAAFNKI